MADTPIQILMDKVKKKTTLDEDQIVFIKKRVKELGSQQAVAAQYWLNDNVSWFAKEYSKIVNPTEKENK